MKKISPIVFHIFIMIISLTLNIKAQTLIYFTEDFENGLSKWSVSGLGWDVTSNKKYSGSYCLTDSKTGNYPANANIVISTIDQLDLTKAVNPYISFWDTYSIYSSGALNLDISKDNGNSWTTLNTISGDARQSNWNFKQYSLQSFVGNKIKIRFRLTSGLYTGDGYYVDNIVINEKGTDTSKVLQLPFTEDFENGLLSKWSVSGLGWDITSNKKYSGSYCLTDSKTGNYPANANIVISTIDQLDLTKAVNPYISFWDTYSIYSSGALNLDISKDNGNSWTTLNTISGDANQGTLNSQDYWDIKQYSLQSFVGNKIKIRFRLTSGLYTGDGYYVDNIVINEKGTDTSKVLQLPFTEDFENGLLSKWSVSGLGWDITSNKKYSGSYCLTNSKTGNYPANANIVISTIDQLDLTKAVNPYISFWDTYSICSSGALNLDISKDNGNSWTTLNTISGNARQGNWNFKQYSLQGFVGNKIKIRFRLTSGSYTDDWYYVDDIFINDKKIDTSRIHCPSFLFKIKGIDGGGQEDTRSFGINPDANYCLDYNLGEQVLPPIPNSYPYFDMRWKAPNTTASCFEDGISLDLRPFTNRTQVDTFLLHFEPGWGGFPFTFKWNSGFSRNCDSMKFYYSGLNTGLVIIDMLTEFSTVITDPFINSIRIIKWGAKDTVSFYGPKLISPAYAIANQSTTIDLLWENLAVKEYRIQISTDPGFLAIVFDNTSVTTSIHVESLVGNTTYYWRVKANNEDGGSCWSDVGMFSTALNEIAYNTWQYFKVDQNSAFISRVQQRHVGNLYIIMKKTTRKGYRGTWSGELILSKDGTQIATRSGNDDFDIHIPSADSGYYDIKINSNELGEGIIKICSILDTVNIGEWKIGNVLRPQGSDWQQVDIPSDQDTLYIQTEGMGLWSTIDVYRKILGSNKEHWHFENYGAGYKIKGQIKKPIGGIYYIRYMDSAVLLGDSTQNRQYMLLISTHSNDLPPLTSPTISNLSSYKGCTGDRITLLVSGAGFDKASSVSLIRSGFTDKKADSIYCDPIGRNLTISLDLMNVSSGEWYLQIMNPNGQSVISSKPFIVEDIGETDCFVEIVGRDLIRVGRYQTYIIQYGNKGNKEAKMVPLWIAGFPHGTEVKILSDIVSPVILGFDSLDYNSIPIEIDDTSGVSIPLLISSIPPGYVGNIQISVKLPDSLSRSLSGFSLKSWLCPPIGRTQSLTKSIKKQTINSHVECFADIFGLALDIVGYFLPAKCATSAAFYFLSALNEEIFMSKPQNVFSLQELLVGNMTSVIPTLKDCGVDFLPPPIKALAKAFGTTVLVNSVINNCGDTFTKVVNTVKNINSVGSITPEDKYGPSGYDDAKSILTGYKRFVNPSDCFQYRVDYWNKEDATAPAQEVFIKDTISTNLDLSTLNFTEVGFLKWTVPLEGGQYFNINVDMRPDVNLIVNVEGKLDVKTRAIKWTFRSLDPLTKLLPEDPMTGFLPPIDSTGYQIGWVKYSIKPFTGLSSGTKILNQAFVNFDGIGPWGPAPKEAPFLNTIDAVSPSSKIDSLSAMVSDTTIELRFLGWDDLLGSGIASYSVYVSTDGGAFALWKSNIKDTKVLFTGMNNHSYAFYSIAHDGVGNKEMMKLAPDVSTKIMITSVLDKLFIPAKYDLLQNYPNPFNPVTTLKYNLPVPSKVILKIYNILGQEVKTVVDEEQSAGYKSVTWDSHNNCGHSVASGVYLYRLEAKSLNSSQSFTQVKKMVLLK